MDGERVFDIKELKDKITNGGIAVNEQLEQRILNDQMTDKDYEFISRVFGAIRTLRKEG